MASIFYEVGSHFNSLEILRGNNVKILTQTEDSTIQKLAFSIPERTFKLIIAKGRSINHCF